MRERKREREREREREYDGYSTPCHSKSISPDCWSSAASPPPTQGTSRNAWGRFLLYDGSATCFQWVEATTGQTHTAKNCPPQMHSPSPNQATLPQSEGTSQPFSSSTPVLLPLLEPESSFPRCTPFLLPGPCTHTSSCFWTQVRSQGSESELEEKQVVWSD